MTQDYTKLDGAALITACGDDARKWAEAFCQHFPDAELDQELLSGWFANAIEHSTDVRNARLIYISPRRSSAKQRFIDVLKYIFMRPCHRGM